MSKQKSEESNPFPKITRIYQNHHLDSTRWNLYSPKAGDVLITTSYKSGTTWVQSIVYHLLYGKKIDKFPIDEVAYWVDNSSRSGKEELSAWIQNLKQRRILKSHLSLDGLPYYPELKYIVVARDSRDVFMSWFNHYSNYSDKAYEVFNNKSKLIGDELPPCPKDPRVAWKSWITKGWFEWESEGYPWWGNMHHTQTYWNYRHLPNLLLLHYSDLLNDPSHYVKKIADFIDVAVDDTDIQGITEKTQFKTMKKSAKNQKNPGKTMPRFFKGGTDAFFFKGTNGRWKDVLTTEDLELYEKTKKKVLSPDCAEWLENGWQGFAKLMGRY